MFRKEALIHSTQPEKLDDLWRVNAPHERLFLTTLLIFIFLQGVLVVWVAFAF